MRSENPEYITVVCDGADIAEVHIFTCEPTGGRSAYKALTSMTWFHERQSKKPHSRFSLGWFTQKQHHDASEERHKKRCAENGRTYEYVYAGIPHFIHTSLWDMYKAAGYDYKNQRWVR